MSNDNLNNDNKRSYFYSINKSDDSNSDGSIFGVIDPNKTTDGSFKKNNTDELVLYVSLKAQRRPRVVTLNTPDAFQDDQEAFAISFTQKIDPVNFNNPNNLDYFTTQWTDLFNETRLKNYESFGIKDIKIKVNASMLPEVDITFVDVRAKTLFEGGNDPKNPYNLFFNLPYPLFQLTVKGYYGKSIDMPLQLIKANTKLDSSTGNYEISCKFTSWTFGILNDLIMFYGFVTPFMYLTNDGSYEGQNKINKIFERQISKDPKSDFAGYNRINYPTIYDITTLNTKIGEIGKNLNNNNEELRQITDYDYVDNELGKLLDSLIIFKNGNTLIDKNIENALNIYNDLLKTYETTNRDIVDNYLIAFDDYRGKGDALIKDIQIHKEKIIAKRNDAKEKYTNVYTNFITQELGYKPTIKNMMQIIFNNMQAFIELLDEKAGDAIRQIDEGDKISNVNPDEVESYKLKNDPNSNNYLVPFPDFYKKNNDGRFEKYYPDNEVEKSNWAEIIFINEMFAGKTRINTAFALGNNPNQTTSSNYFNVTNNVFLNEQLIHQTMGTPKNPLDSYIGGINEVVKLLLKNFYYIHEANLDIINGPISDNDLEKYFEIMGRLEADNFINRINSSSLLDDTKKNIFNELYKRATDSSTFLSGINLTTNDDFSEIAKQTTIYGNTNGINDQTNGLYSFGRINDFLINIVNNSVAKTDLFDLNQTFLNYDKLLKITDIEQIKANAPCIDKNYNNGIYDNTHTKYN